MLEHLPTSPAEPPATLRLFQPEQPDPIQPPDQPPPAPKRPPLTLTAAMRKYVLPPMRELNRSPATIADVERSVREWTEYWTERQAAEPTSGSWMLDPLVARSIRRRHLAAWRSHLIGLKKADGSPRLAPDSVNRKLGAIRQVLNAAEKNGRLKRSRPKLEKLPSRPAPKWYFKHDQVAALWQATESLTWPKTPGMTTAEWWKCALALLWVYGFRTQEMIAFQPGKHALTWRAIAFDAETPNPEGTAENALGWLSYVPQKQSWAKPDPLYLPLTRHTRAAVDRLRSAAVVAGGDTADPARSVFPWPRSGKTLYRQWANLQEKAGVRTKAGQPFELKHFRKTAATYLEKHHKGLGAAVCGWADRDVSEVMARHYCVDELTLVEKLASYTVPDCFDELLSRGG